MNYVEEAKEAIKILKKIKLGYMNYDISLLSQKESEILIRNNLFPQDKKQLIDHNTIINHLLTIKENGSISKGFAVNLFLHAVNGNFPRGKQALASYLLIDAMEPHDYDKCISLASCCTCHMEKIVDRSQNDYIHVIECFYNGYIERHPLWVYYDTKEIIKYHENDFAKPNKDLLLELLKIIDSQSENCTPGQLEQKISTSKLLKKTNKSTRRSILEVLAIAGVLPYSSESAKLQPIRSDIMEPLGGWRGYLGVNYQRVEELFEINFSNSKKTMKYYPLSCKEIVGIGSYS